MIKLSLLASKNIITRNNYKFINNVIRTITTNNNNNNDNSNNNNVGLLGINELKTSNGWNELCNKKINRINEITNDILKPGKINSQSKLVDLKQTLYYIDEISQQLCDLMDPARFVMITLPNGNEHKIESTNAFFKMSDTVNQLNANSNLYEILLEIRNHSLYSKLETDHKLFLNEMIKESEANGINLKPEKKDEIMKIKDEIYQQGSMFIESSSNCYKSPPSTMIEMDYSILKKWLPHKYLLHLPPLKQPYYNLKNDKIQFSPTDYLVSGILKYIPDSNIRKSIHDLQSTSSCYNSVLLHLSKMISTRYKLAKALGCSTYADYELKNKLLKSPNQVEKYLIELSEKTKLKSDMELLKLIEIKKQMEPNNQDNDKIYTWDLPFYKNQMSTQFYKNHSLDKEELSNYFTLENVLRGLNLITTKLFGATLSNVPMDKGESWDPNVLKLLLSKNNITLGIMYLDPWERLDKATGCVNHSIGFGYKKHDILFKQSEQYNGDGGGQDPDIDENGEFKFSNFKIPKCSITCSFNQNNFNDPLKSRLQHSEVEILFHEAGHGFHSLLSRCNFQHLCGTRGPTDFIEIPSTLMENLSWNSELLQQFAINQNGKPISEEMVMNLKKTRNLFQGIETQEQIALALLDLKLHTISTKVSSSINEDKMKLDNDDSSPSKLLSRINLNQIGIHGTVSNFFLTSFNHLFYYGASYYSYLLAKDYSKRIWVNHFDNGNKLNRVAGEYYQKNFLQPGASIDPSLILNKFIK